MRVLNINFIIAAFLMGFQDGSFGLYYEHQGKVKAIPLEKIDIKVKIIEGVAKVEYSQLYSNETSKTLEIYYLFPVSTTACFDSFSAKYKSDTMEGVIKAKEEANQEYYKAKAKGSTVAYAAIQEETEDIMLVKIGNMEPKTSITINLTFIEQLETSVNKFWRYHVLAGLQPRYSSPNTLLNHRTDNHLTIKDYPLKSSDDHDAYVWNVEIEIESNSEITFVDSPVYKVNTTYTNQKKFASIKLDPSKRYTPSVDFVLYYSNSDINKPQVLVTKNEDLYCAMINFVPETSKQELSDAYKAALESNQTPDVDIENVRGEYIFLIDRSGSMSGSFINTAKQALVIFLKSLPKNSLFNIVSFGSNYHVLHYESLESNEENINKAVKLVNNFSADMGGTELMSPFILLISQKFKVKLRFKM